MLHISTSALKPSQYRKFVRGWDKGRYADIFAAYTSDPKAYRFSLPLAKTLARDAKPVEPLPSVKAAVESAGYIVDDYIGGYAVDSATGKRRVRIGKILKSSDVAQEFANDKRRGAAKQKSGALTVVISRHPYDVAGMSTDRGWTSCMNLIDGQNKHYVNKDVKEGSLIAYLVDATDLNIQSPKARILMRVFKAKGKIGLFPSGVYGTAPDAFALTVSKWCSEVNSKFFKIPYGTTMKMLSSLYPDSATRETHLPQEDTAAANIRTLLDAPTAPSKISEAVLRNTYVVLVDNMADREARAAGFDPNSYDASAKQADSVIQSAKVFEAKYPSSVKAIRSVFVPRAMIHLRDQNLITNVQRLPDASREYLTSCIAQMISLARTNATKREPNIKVFKQFNTWMEIKGFESLVFSLSSDHFKSSPYSGDDVVTFIKDLFKLAQYQGENIYSNEPSYVDALSDRDGANVADLLFGLYLEEEDAKKLAASFEEGSDDYLLAQFANYCRGRITIKQLLKQVGKDGLVDISGMRISYAPQFNPKPEFIAFARVNAMPMSRSVGTLRSALNAKSLESVIETLKAGNKTSIAVALLAAHIRREGYNVAKFIEEWTAAAPSDPALLGSDILIRVAESLYTGEKRGLMHTRKSSPLFGNSALFKKLSKTMRAAMIASISTEDAALVTMEKMFNSHDPNNEVDISYHGLSHTQIVALGSPLAPYLMVAIPFVTGCDHALGIDSARILTAALPKRRTPEMEMLLALHYIFDSEDFDDKGRIDYIERLLPIQLLDTIASPAWKQLEEGVTAFMAKLPPKLRAAIGNETFTYKVKAGIQSMIDRLVADEEEDFEEDVSLQRRVELAIEPGLRRRLSPRKPNPADVTRYAAALIGLAQE
jgi:hypothetical protein